MGAEVAVGAAIVSAIAGAASTGYSMYNGNKQDHAQKRAAREQQRAIDEEKASALETRKQMIDQQRMQLSGTGMGTRGFSKQGIRARLGGDTLG